jgi:hypothetical protein
MPPPALQRQVRFERPAVAGGWLSLLLALVMLVVMGKGCGYSENRDKREASKANKGDKNHPCSGCVERRLHLCKHGWHGLHHTARTAVCTISFASSSAFQNTGTMPSDSCS